MTQVCRVCSHKDRKKIDREIVDGANIAGLSKKYGISTNSLYRHKQEHIGGNLARRAASSLENHHQALLDRLVNMLAKAEAVVESAERDGHRGLTLKGIETMNKVLPNLARTIAIMFPQELQSMTEAELAEFKEWKANKDRPVDPLALDKLTSAERRMVESLARKKLAETDMALYSKDQVIDIEPVEEVPEVPVVKRMRRRKKV